MGPSGAVVGDAITAGEGGFVGDGLAGIEFAGEGVGVGLTGMHLTDVVPCGAIYAYADEPLGAGEDDAAMAVIPSVVLVLLKHRELDFVHHDELVEGQSEGHCCQYVYLYQGHSALKVVTQRCVVVPLFGQSVPWRQAFVFDAPLLMFVGGIPYFRP